MSKPRTALLDRWVFVKHNIRSSWRWVFNVECREPFCHERRRCWRWHVEYLECPTCKREASEFTNAFVRIFDATMDRGEPVELTGKPFITVIPACTTTSASTRAFSFTTTSWPGSP